MNLEDRIRELAHRIWEHEGRPEGRHLEHWEQACREMEFVGRGEAGPAPSGGSRLAGADDIETGVPEMMEVDEMNVVSASEPSDAWPTTGRSRLVGT